MEIEKLARILIYLHAGLGGLALLAGAIALIVKKGAYYHRLSGKVFFLQYARLCHPGINNRYTT